VPGSEIARLSKLEDTQEAPISRETAAPAKPEPSLNTSYRLLDNRIHQALMMDIAEQQHLRDAIQKLDESLRNLTQLVEKLGANAPRHDTRAPPIAPSQPQFLRLKEVMARVGLRVNTIYRYVARGAFPNARKFGRSSFWVTSEVNDWIAKRTAGVPLDSLK
jgi:predicted DNA-binding transcriptional regulator AlpA